MSDGLALVTGASSGLGRAVALELGRRRRGVVLLARDAARLEAARAESEALGGRARLAVADVTDAPGLRRAIDAALGTEPLTLVVHAAGILTLGRVEDVDEAALRAMLEVNVVGAAAVTRACLPRLAATRGHLVLVASIAARTALPGGFSGYGASKWALRGWAEAAREELAARGIGLTVAYPSILDTAMVSGQHGPGAPAVYRAFPWHAPDAAARRLLDDAERGRRESYVTAGDRLSAWAAGAMPTLFTAGLRAVLRLRTARATGSQS